MNHKLLRRFINRTVTVNTSVGSVTGILMRADSSRHGGIGLLYLAVSNGIYLIKTWISISR